MNLFRSLTLMGCMFLTVASAMASVVLKTPANSAVNTTRQPVLSWQPVKSISSDITYDLYLDDQAVPARKIASGIRDTSFQAYITSAYTTCYWKVVAMSGTQQIDQSAVYSFTPWSSPQQPLAIDMIPIEAATYSMGSGSYNVVQPGLGTGPLPGGSYPQHSVTLGGYSIGKYEITYEQYTAFLNAVKNNLRIDAPSNRVYFQRPGESDQLLCDVKADAAAFDVRKHSQLTWDGTSFAVRPGFESYPMSWMYSQGALLFADWAGHRLPTEAEWEYAARGGKYSAGYEYSGSNNYDAASWYIWNSVNMDNPVSGTGAGVPARDNRGSHPVGLKLANELGIYDMSGNVNEFCNDLYDINYYSTSESIMPQGPVDSAIVILASKGGRVLRGGSWDDLARDAMVAYRKYELIPEYAHKLASGFRTAGNHPQNTDYYIQGIIRDEWGKVLPGIDVQSASGMAATANSGRYILKLSAGTTAEVRPVMEGYEFSPAVIYIENLQEHLTELNFVAYLKREHIISGIITDAASNPVPGVYLNGLPGNIRTDVNGRYTVSVPDGADYTFKPERIGYQFQPSSVTISDIHAGKTNVDIAATYVGIVRISGTINRVSNGSVIGPESGVYIKGFATDMLVSGTYSYYVTKGWSGEIKAMRDNNLFSPASAVITNIQADLVQNFDYMSTPSANKTITGIVKDHKNLPVEGVEIMGFGSPVFTNPAGEFHVKVAANWTGTITPVYLNYTFTPPSLLLTGPYDNMPPVNFVMNPPGDYLLSGTVRDKNGNPLQGIAITGFTSTVRTGIDGTYAVWVPASYAGTVNASYNGFSVNPSGYTLASLTSDRADLDFDIQPIVSATLDQASFPFTIYPNPSADFCRISGTSEYALKIFTLNGICVESLQIHQDGVFGEALPAGIYMVRIQAGESVYHVKFVKQ